MAEHSAVVEVNGHRVPADQIDLFLSGRTGHPISDDQWDRAKRARTDADGTNDDLIPEEHR
ncbi:hypothetical protein [Leifsonia aquatica]|uniref:hypothetical protein n=1 Tax=Leifsonia aquatica TaxID=144185 RepID=UPI0013B362D1|nr:hypothetical protein [Leifsonia aquatica]